MKKFHNEDLNSLYSSPNIIRMIKSREWNGWAMQHAWKRQEMHTKFWWTTWKKRLLGRPRHKMGQYLNEY